MSEFQAIWFTTSAIIITQLFMSVEYLFLFNKRRFTNDTLFAWNITSSRPGWIYTGWRIAILNWLFSPQRLKIMVLARCLLALTVFFIEKNNLYLSIILGMLFLISCLLNTRHFQGRDGADEISNVVLFGLLAYYIVDHRLMARWAGPLFIVAQITLSYFISGYYKAISATWRSGNAVKMVVATEIYGQPRLSFILKNKAIAVTFSWIIILWEVTFPLVWVIPYPYNLAWLFFGVLFHIVMAVMMGLNTFMFAFLSCYPLLYFFLTSEPNLLHKVFNVSSG